MKDLTAKIIVVERSLIIYEGLCSVLLKSRGNYHIHRVGSLDELQKNFAPATIDIVLINPIEIQSSLKIFSGLKKEYSHIRWIGIIYQFIDQQVLSLLHDNFSITDSPEKISGIIQELHNKEVPDEESISGSLSERETDVLRLLVKGNSNKEIADRLHISTHTVISHRKNISQKTGIKSVSGLTIYAVVSKIISLRDYSE